MEYLAFLSHQRQTVCLKDFKKLRKKLKEELIKDPSDIVRLISNPMVKQYLKNNNPNWWKQAEKDKKECTQLGISYTYPFHEDYPTRLLDMKHPPLCITWKGKACWKNNFILSVVGSRHAYSDTLLWMDMHLSSFLKGKKNIIIASGGARGVDQKAHSLSLANSLPTLCFLPCGIKDYYPKDLYKWSEAILKEGGAFLSVFPLDEPIKKFHFYIRNQVLAFFSHLIFIAQAELRSGTMMTARCALNAGVNLASLPGSPLHSGYHGNLSLIHDGCLMIRDHLDLETFYQSMLITSPSLTHLPSPFKKSITN